jgi:hypothetical protein
VFWPSVPIGDGLLNLSRTLGVLSSHDFSGLLAIEIDYLHPRYRDEGLDEDDALADSIGRVRDALAGWRRGRELSR